MRIKSMKLKNFRGYQNEIRIEFEDMTVFVGKNDVGKSTILEALDIFFNDGKGSIKIDKTDLNVLSASQEDNDIEIAVCFDELPSAVVIDSMVETSLEEEYLLNRNGELEVIKRYPNGGSPKVFIKSYHPCNPCCSDLLLKKNAELKRIIRDEEIESADQSINASMRKEIWSKYSNSLQLEEIEIDAAKEDAKKIWEKLSSYLPLYTLFQSDRRNSDSDSEIQDPLREAVKQIINNSEIQQKLSEVADRVKEEIEEVSRRTLDKLREMDEDIANSLNPVIPATNVLKWQDVFKNVSISGDENIPINKRGSGVRRLILLNFFRGDAERRAENSNSASVIYAIEEPETSQHTVNQVKLIEALKLLAASERTQIILTTHSSNIVKCLNYSNLRLIKDDNAQKSVVNVPQGQLAYPSLNEVNYIAFGEATEEYHNELYGHIESQNLMDDFKQGRSKRKYLKQSKKKPIIETEIVLSEYIRHQIHHPENTLNVKYTKSELEQSVEEMRQYISSCNQKNATILIN